MTGMIHHFHPVKTRRTMYARGSTVSSPMAAWIQLSQRSVPPGRSEMGSMKIGKDTVASH